MADGASKTHDVIFTSTTTADASPVNCGTWTPASGTGLADLRAEVWGFDALNASIAFRRTVYALARVNSSGSAAIIGTPANVGDIDFNTSNASATIDDSSGTIRVRVTGHATVGMRWFSRLHVDYGEENWSLA